MTERPEERDSLANAERLCQDVLDTPANKRERELGGALRTLINEVKVTQDRDRMFRERVEWRARALELQSELTELRERNEELERELKLLRFAEPKEYGNAKRWERKAKQMEEALREIAELHVPEARNDYQAIARRALAQGTETKTDLRVEGGICMVPGCGWRDRGDMGPGEHLNTHLEEEE